MVTGGEGGGGGGGGGGVGGGGGGAFPDMVAQMYYRYGLMVAKHPRKGICLAIASFIIVCTPLWHLPLPGYFPQDYITSIHNHSVPRPAPESGIPPIDPSPTPTPLWYQGPPRAYIQQIVVKSGVVPWKEGLTMSDSYRGPLSSVFHLAETISNYQLNHNHSVTLGTECLLIEGVVKKVGNGAGQVPVLPHYNCLMLSPADLWARNQYSFLQDQHVLLTVNSLMASYEGETNVADILFGVPAREIGFRRTRNPERVITYAVTLALKEYNEEFVNGLEKELSSRYPIHQPVIPARQQITHIYFPSRLSLWEFLLIIFYLILFICIYFSFLRLKSFKSKFGMAFSVQITLIASLCMSVGLCAYFGLRPLHSKGKFVYPVLAGLLGFENSMVLIRSFLSTPTDLDIKIRMAQGLAREGWTITKYFLTMITIVTLSFFLFIPLVQEFCIYGTVVLMCDLYMQLIFLTSVLAIDQHRYEELKDPKKHNVQPKYYNHRNFQTDRLQNTGFGILNLSRRIPQAEKCNGNRVAQVGHSLGHHVGHRLGHHTPPRTPEQMPKRLRVAYFFAQRRMFQRMFICVFVGWIAFMVYSSGLIDHFSEPINDLHNPRDLPSVIFSLTNRSSYIYDSRNSVGNSKESRKKESVPLTSINETHKEASETPHETMKLAPSLSSKNTSDENFEMKQLKHRSRSILRKLPHSHWPTLFSYYNISLTGHYISILPPILLSVPVTPEDALNVHNPNDPNGSPWLPDVTHSDATSIDGEEEFESAFIPSSSGELMLTAVLVIPAVLFLVYATVALYHCVCSRNYAEWRASWWGGGQDSSRDETSQIIGDALPLKLTGHNFDVECMCTDGMLLVSSCLGGDIRVWKPSTGAEDCVAYIDRRRPHKPEFRAGSPEDERISDYGSGSPQNDNPLSCDNAYFRGAEMDPDEYESDGDNTELGVIRHDGFGFARQDSLGRQNDGYLGRQDGYLGRQNDGVWRQNDSVGRQDGYLGRQSDSLGRQNDGLGRQDGYLGKQNDGLWRQDGLGNPISQNTRQRNPFKSFPDVTPTIDMRFKSSQNLDTTRTPQETRDPHTGTNTGHFSHIQKCYDEHWKILQDEENYKQQWRKTTDSEYRRKTSDTLDQYRQMRKPSDSNDRTIDHRKDSIDRTIDHRKPSDPIDLYRQLRKPSDSTIEHRKVSENAIDHRKVFESAVNHSADGRKVFESAIDHRKVSEDATDHRKVSANAIDHRKVFESTIDHSVDARKVSDPIDLHRQAWKPSDSIDTGTPIDHRKVSDSFDHRKVSDSFDHRKVSDSFDHRKVSDSFDHRKVSDSFDRRKVSESASSLGSSPSYTSEPFRTIQRAHSYTQEQSRMAQDIGRRTGHRRQYSDGNVPLGVGLWDSEEDELPPVWCLECQEPLVIVGCGSGRVEVWHAYKNIRKCIYEDVMRSGVTSMRMSGSQLMVARLSGGVDMLRLEAADTSHQQTHQYKPGHSRGGSGDYTSGWATFCYDEPLQLTRYAVVKAHQQPITVITCDHIRLITGSHDHTLKVFNMRDGSLLFPLHGHCGPITSVFIDGSRESLCNDGGSVSVDLGVAAIIGSGSQDGMLWVWDAYTGACVYSVQAHDGIITTLTCTNSYILSLGGDDKLCVWERFQGHLLNTLQITQMYCTSMVMLTNKLLITSRQGSLTVWDITSGMPVRIIRLGDNDDSVFIRHLMPFADTIVCDYGKELRVVRLPVADKLD